MSELTETRPALSVIVPAHNVGKYIENCLRSIFNQSCADYELIVIDDGSTDDTPDVIARLRAAREFIYISQPNEGASAARNRGIDAARGEYLCFIDGDDSIERNYIQDLLARAAQTRADVVSSGYTLINGESITGTFPADKWDVELSGKRVSLMCVPTTRIYRADFLRAHGIRFTVGERFDVVSFSLLVNMLAGSVENIPNNNYRYYARPQSFVARLRRGQISAASLPRRALADAIAYLAPRCDHEVLEFCVVKILAGVLFQNLRKNPIDIVDAFSECCVSIMDKYFSKAHKNTYISVFKPASLPFIQRAAMKTFVIMYKTRALRIFARAFTRL